MHVESFPAFMSVWTWRTRGRHWILALPTFPRRSNRALQRCRTILIILQHTTRRLKRTNYFNLLLGLPKVSPKALHIRVSLLSCPDHQPRSMSATVGTKYCTLIRLPRPIIPPLKRMFAAQADQLRHHVMNAHSLSLPNLPTQLSTRCTRGGPRQPTWHQLPCDAFGGSGCRHAQRKRHPVVEGPVRVSPDGSGPFFPCFHCVICQVRNVRYAELLHEKIPPTNNMLPQACISRNTGTGAAG